jgi:cytochrome c553
MNGEFRFAALFVAGCHCFFALSVTLGEERDDLFEKSIRPVLVDRCVKCHGATKQESGLRLDQRAAILRGGDTGPAIDLKKPDASLLLNAIRQTGDLKMPPQGKLSDDQIAAFARWIKLGASWPEQPSSTLTKTDPKQHWAFQRVRRPRVPNLGETTWPVNEIDAFVRQRLRSAKLTPAARATARTLVRRASFDLLGLPPTPELVAEFSKAYELDPNTAFRELIDQLLKSPQYGERWGRYWLDVARYADNKGYVFFEDKNFASAWTYRDYVVRAFNEDLPYDQFIIEQLAADQLDLGDDKRALAAMGYLTVGARFMNNSHDVIDDRIDVVTRGLMGLTVTCARCHDHKFDPIPQADYYSLYGVFRSSFEPLVLPLFQKVPTSPEYEKFKAGMQERLGKLNGFMDKQRTLLITEARKRANEYLLAVHKRRNHPNTENFMLLTEKGAIIPRIIGRWETHLKVARRLNSPVWSAWFAFSDIDDDEWAKQLPIVYAQVIKNDKLNPLVRQALQGKRPATMLDVANTYGALFQTVDSTWQKLEKEAGEAKSPAPVRLSDASAEELRLVLYGPGSPPMLPRLLTWGFLDLLPDRPTQNEFKKLLKEVESWSRSGPGAPPRAMVLEDRAELYDPVIFVRGNPNRHGVRVPRQMPAIVANSKARVFRNGSGRLEFAKQIASPDNPLTARVLVNRVWHHHFGTGLVSTNSDFGIRSTKPSHRELLDWLASEFVQQGWSIKHLHRLIMNSATYQQSSERDAASTVSGLKVDATNRLLWKFNRRRLDFESMRDSLLFVTGSLNTTSGGPATNIDGFNPRRTIYGFVNRMDLPNLRRAFDFPEPAATSPKRTTTTIAPQALYFMNHSFVYECARRTSRRADVIAAGDSVARVNRVYRLLFGRDAEDFEIKLADQFVNQSIATAKEADAWRYGYGGVDEQAERVKQFTPLTFWTGTRWQAGPRLPDPQVGWVFFDANGGHPSSSVDRCAIRRWTAPCDGTIEITGALEHQPEEGNGVRARIVSSRAGFLGEWVVDHSKAETNMKSIQVKQGDTIDFVADWRDHITHDEHIWRIKIRLTPTDSTKLKSQRTEWDSVRDFKGEQRDRWADYVHALLMTNEFLFVD